MNEKRWKPELGEKYWFVTSAGRPSTDVNNLGLADNRFNLGNCFETEAEAQAAAEKFKALFLSLHGDGENLQHDDLPKLTTEVFDHPACPGWAKWAAVDEYGTVWLTAEKPNVIMVASEANGWSTGGSSYTHLASVRFDASDWQNSLIERPAKLPEWCKVDAMGWHKRCGYFKVTYIDDVFKRVDIQWIDDKSSGYFSFHTVYNETVQAKPRPYNAEEMQKLVGKVLDLDGNRDLVTSYDENSESVYADAMWINSDELLSIGYTIDGEPCGKLVHKDGDDWVE